MSAESTVEALIADQQQSAKDSLTKAQEFGDLAQSAATSVTSLPSPQDVDEPNVLVPAPPTNDQGGEFLDVYNGAFDDYNPQFSSVFQAFLDEFFPDVDGCVMTLTDKWICDTLTIGGTGLPAAIEQQIWDRARARESELLQKSIEDANDEWAGRGFSIPPGQLVDMVDRARVEGNNKVSTLARDIAIKNQEIEIENVRLAVKHGIEMRIEAAKAAVDYIKAWFLVPNTAIEKAKALTDTRFRFFQTSSAYYNAIIGAADLKLRAQIFNSDKIVRDNTNFVNLVTGNASARVNAAVGSAEAMGKAAAAALGALNTLANIGNITNQQQ